MCGTRGKHLYRNISDKLFSAPGIWNLDQCQNKSCGTLWLNPYPNTEIIPLFYTDYHTHKNIPLHFEHAVRRKSVVDKMRNAYLYTHYKYGEYTKYNWLFNILSYIHPGWQDARASNHFYLPKVSDGLFLDIGCGAGGSMAAMRERGWQTYGIDFDKKALTIAQSRGLTCATGGLLEQGFPSSHFDAILLSHVIEHLPNPEEVLLESYRILKPGGKISLITPNSRSWSHMIFGKNWRGLEIPRHLQIFTPRSLGQLALKAGFSKVKYFSSPHGEMFFIRESLKIVSEGDEASILQKKFLKSKIIEHIGLLLFGWINILIPERCGMTIVVGTK